MRALLALLLFAAFIIAARAAIYVAPTGADADGCGSAADPCASLAYATSLVSSRADILLESGVHVITGSASIGTGTTVSVAPAQPGSAAVIDCLSNAFTVISAPSGSNLTLSSITIRNCKQTAISSAADSLTIADCAFAGNGVNTMSGGAVHVWQGAALIKNTTFSGNYATSGGAVKVRACNVFRG